MRGSEKRIAVIGAYGKTTVCAFLQRLFSLRECESRIFTLAHYRQLTSTQDFPEYSIVRIDPRQWTETVGKEIFDLGVFIGFTGESDARVLKDISDHCGSIVVHFSNHQVSRELYDSYRGCKWSFSAEDMTADILARDLQPDIYGTKFIALYDGVLKKTAVSGPGDLLLKGGLAALATLIGLGFCFEEVCELLPEAGRLKGQLEIVSVGEFTVIRDDVRNAQRLSSALFSLKPFVTGKSVVLIAPDERVSEKEYKRMGQAVSAVGATAVIVSGEGDTHLLDSLKSGFPKGRGYTDTQNIEDAIELTLEKVGVGDIIVLVVKDLTPEMLEYLREKVEEKQRG